MDCGCLETMNQDRNGAVAIVSAAGLEVHQGHQSPKGQQGHSEMELLVL